MLQLHERRALLRHARRAISARLEGRTFPAMTSDGRLCECASVFVTIRYNDQLRGCVGSLERDYPLVDAVARCAGDAAMRDPRFAPVSLNDLPHVILEISVLGPLKQVQDPTMIEVGRHGLVVEQGAYRGLLLPQVATEWGWNREMFLSQTCLKAGLSAQVWRTGAKVFVFEAYVFRE